MTNDTIDMSAAICLLSESDIASLLKSAGHTGELPAEFTIHTQTGSYRLQFFRTDLSSTGLTGAFTLARLIDAVLGPSGFYVATRLPPQRPDIQRFLHTTASPFIEPRCP